MTAIDSVIHDFKRLDHLAMGNSWLHRLDPRAKIIGSLAFIIAVVSFPRTEVAGLLPFLLFPLFLSNQADLPLGYFMRKLDQVLPFALVFGAFNPLLDPSPGLVLDGWTVSNGWLSYLSIILRTVLTVSAALFLVGTTGFFRLCHGLEKLGTPRIFAMQLLLLYRYIFVLIEEAARAIMARTLRSAGKRGQGLVPTGQIIGHLLLRSWQRAERIHMAMLARGFDGHFPNPHPDRFGPAEVIFCLTCLGCFTLFRLFNLPDLIGNLVMGALS